LLVLVGLCVVWLTATPAKATLAADAFAVEDGEERDCQGDCPEDEDDGECPTGCDACSCCPAAASPAVSAGGVQVPYVTKPSSEQRVSSSGESLDGTRSRVFHPPRPAIS
jgi:hypothetical protein